VTKKIRFSKCEVNELAWHPSGDYLYLTKGSKDGSLDEGVVQIMQHKNNNLHPVHEVRQAHGCVESTSLCLLPNPLVFVLFCCRLWPTLQQHIVLSSTSRGGASFAVAWHVT